MNKVFAFLISLASVGLAQTTNYWQLQNGAAGTSVSTTEAALGGGAMQGLGFRVGSGTLPVFAAQTPGTVIWDGNAGALLSSNNTGSVFLVQDTPSTTEKKGGCIGITNTLELFQLSAVETNAVKPFTIELFAKVGDLRGQWTDIFGLARSGGNATVALQITSASNLQIRVDCNLPGTGNTDGWNTGVGIGTRITDAQWHHIALTYNGAQTVKCYVDYKEVGSLAPKRPLVLEPDYARFNIGWGNSNVGKPFAGWLDEVRVTQSVLATNQFLRVAQNVGTVRCFYPIHAGTTGQSFTTATNSYNSNSWFTARTSGTTWSAKVPGGGTVLSDGTTPLRVDRTTAFAADSTFTVLRDVLAGVTNFTAELFFNMATPGTLVSRGAAWSAGIDTDGIPVLTINGAPFKATEAVAADTWHHFAVRHDSASTRLFIDGTAVIETDAAIPTDYSAIVFGNGLAGNLFGIRLVDTALESSAFLSLDSRSASGTLGYWKFEDTPTNALMVTRLGEVQNYNFAPVYVGRGDIYGTCFTKPKFTNDVPGVAIWNRNSGKITNPRNEFSVRFWNNNLTTNTSGDGTRVEIPGFTNATPASVTVETFVKVARDISYGTMLGKNRAGTSFAAWALDIENGRARLRIDPATDVADLGNNAKPTWNLTLASTTPIADGQWHHVAFTFDNVTTNAKIYVDYRLENNRTFALPLAYAPALSLSLGATVSRAFDGQLDEVRVTEGVLSTNDFLRVFTPKADIRGLWLMNGAAANELYHPSDSYLQGTAVGGVSDSLELPDRIAVVKDRNRRFPLYKTARFDNGIYSIPCAATVGSSNFTAEVFFNGNGILMSKPAVAGHCWKVDTASDGTLRAVIATQVPGQPYPDGLILETLTTSVQAADGDWHHAALVYDSVPNKAVLYLDYQPVAERTLVQQPVLNAEDLVLGGFAGDMYGMRYSGSALVPADFLVSTPPDATRIILR